MHKKLGDKKKRKQKKMLDNNYFVFDAYAKTAIISHANKGHFSRIEEAKKKKKRKAWEIWKIVLRFWLVFDETSQ